LRSQRIGNAGRKGFRRRRVKARTGALHTGRNSALTYTKSKGMRKSSGAPVTVNGNGQVKVYGVPAELTVKARSRVIVYRSHARSGLPAAVVRRRRLQGSQTTSAQKRQWCRRKVKVKPAEHA
jgi:hypothetical protein